MLLFRLAAKYDTNPRRLARRCGQPLPSMSRVLRTRLSFESALHRLGGDIGVDHRSTTGIAKENASPMSLKCLITWRPCRTTDNNESSLEEMIDLRIPIINAGNGCDEHPTQALADLYASFKWKPN